VVVDEEPDVVRRRQENDEQREAKFLPQHDPRQLRQRRVEFEQSPRPRLQHVDPAALPERTDVTQLAEEHVPNEVVPESDRNVVLGQQALVRDENVVLGEFGAKFRSDWHFLVERGLSKLGESALVA